MPSTKSHPFADYRPGRQSLYRTSMIGDPPHMLVGVVPGYVGDQCLLHKVDGSFDILSPHSLFPLEETEAHQTLHEDWVTPTLALRDLDFSSLYKVSEAIFDKEIELQVRQVYDILKTRTMGLPIKLDIQAGDGSLRECEFEIGPLSLILTDTVAGMTWILAFCEDPEQDEIQYLHSFSWGNRWDAVKRLISYIGQVAEKRAMIDIDTDMIRAMDTSLDPTPLNQIPRVEH